MRKLTLQIKFFLVYLLMALFIIVTFSIIFYWYTSEKLMERETNTVITQNRNILSQTDQVISDMDNVSINIGYSNLIRKDLYDTLDIEVGSDDFRDLANLFISINGTDLKVDQINLYDFNGNVLQVGIRSTTSKVDLDSMEWYESVINNQGKKTLSVPYQTLALNSPGSSSLFSGWFLSLYRTFNNEYKQEIGVIETIKKCSSVFKHVISYERTSNNPANVYIYNEDGSLVYPYDLDESELAEIPDYYNAVASSDSNHMEYRNEKTDTQEICTYAASSYSGWTYVTVLPESYILKPVNDLLKVLVLVGIGVLILSAIISFIFAKRLTRPIKRLRHIIRDTELDNLGQTETRSLHTSFDELEQVNREFTRMQTSLKSSMDQLIESRQQELKSRSLALQSQMNPHFYYNSLASIIVLAENGQSEQVAAMGRNLTKIMRYITDGQAITVTLQNEINYIEQYLYCMKVRYQESLNYEISIDPAILDEPIPKLVIQPLVENALKYGIDVAPPWFIQIKSTVTEDFWRIDVIDSGHGFPPDRLELIQNRIKEASAHPGMPEIQINGMGLLNVYLRWHFFCQEDTIFEYGNTADGHGKVSIGRKYKKQEKQEKQEI